MSVEANKRVIQRFTTECINTASETVAAELIAPDSVFHLPGMSVPSYRCFSRRGVTDDSAMQIGSILRPFHFFRTAFARNEIYVSYCRNATNVVRTSAGTAAAQGDCHHESKSKT